MNESEVGGVCANCNACAGASVDGGDGTVKLKNCTACLLVKYCSVDCQKAHRKQHKKACKKRAAELKDERLYTQGQERSEDDSCPICLLLIPLPKDSHSVFMVCCMKRVCNGCHLAAQKRGMMHDCPFCRTTVASDDASMLVMAQKRVDAKDPQAIKFLGDMYCRGVGGVEQNVPRALELWREAAELGLSEAHFNLGNRYMNGKISDGKGVTHHIAKGVRHWGMAAMKGNVEARCNLGYLELSNGNHERAIKHLLIAAKMGDKVALDYVKKMFGGGLATKEQYAEALKGYQAANVEMKSPERDEAKAFGSNNK